ncbi:MAG: FliI/YscN family ATPase [Myxococcales bacterium]|nr:FliI/YscN family ATPase [Myxococcales bacterium]
MKTSSRAELWRRRLCGRDLYRRRGWVLAARGALLEACLPRARLGEVVQLGRTQAQAEVCGFCGDRAMLLPTCGCQGLAPAEPVEATGEPFSLPWSESLTGCLVDAHARRLDGGPPLPVERRLPLFAAPPDPARRPPIREALFTGVRAIDGLLTLGVGQRVGLYAGPGVGKSTLLGQLARQARVERVVLCLVGERGREVNEFLERVLGPEGRRRTVTVCATSDAPAGERARVLPAATAIAEGFRDRGQSVLLLVDSLTRHVRAMRDVALALGEAPGRRGFPPSVFDQLAGLLERAGAAPAAAITAVYTVLVEGDAEDDPVAQETRGLLDGHIVLSPELARAGLFPAIDPAESLSRSMDGLVGPEQLAAARRVRAWWSAFESRRELIAAGAYQSGAEPLLDEALRRRPRLLEFLAQPPRECADAQETERRLRALVDAESEEGR